MKNKKKKGLLFGLFTTLALTIGFASINSKEVVGAKADQTTFSFANKNQRESLSASAAVFTSGYFTMTVEKNTSSTDIGDYINPVRIYAHHKVTFEAGPLVEKIDSIVITANNNTYANDTRTASWTGATASGSGSVVTATASSSLKVISVVPAKQVRWNSLVINFTPSESSFGGLSSITLNTANVETEYHVGETFSSEGLVVTAFDDSDPVVSKIVTEDLVYSAEGHIFVAEDVGTYTVTVSYTELGITVSTTFDVEVLPPIIFDHAGTLEDPYSPADAIKVAEKTGETPTTESFYIKGIISLVKSVDTGTFGNAEFEIKENLSDSVKFLIFRAFANSDGAPFTTATAADIKVGYEVVVYGKIVNYKGNTPETTAGSKNTANTTHVVSIDKTAATEAANAFAVNFNSAIGAICSLDGESDLVALQAEWLVQKDAFNALVEGSRVIVKASTANSEGSDLEQFTAKYIYIANKYQSLENFVARTEVVVAGVNDTDRITSKQPSNNLAAIAVIGIIGLSTLVGYYFINKKRLTA